MLARLEHAGKNVQREIKVYRLVLEDRRTPLAAKLLLALALGYFLLPFDLIPDFVPLLGQIDDILIVPGLIVLALKLVPRDVVDDCRAKAGEAA